MRQHVRLVGGFKIGLVIGEYKVILVLEPLNLFVGARGAGLVRSDGAIDIVGEVKTPRDKVVLDIDHQQLAKVTRLWTFQGIGKIGHFPATSNLGRYEFNSGWINDSNTTTEI